MPYLFYFDQSFLYFVHLNFTIENIIGYVIFICIYRYSFLNNFEFYTGVLARRLQTLF